MSYEKKLTQAVTLTLKIRTVYQFQVRITVLHIICNS